MFVGRGQASKSGLSAIRQTKAKVARGNAGQINLGKNAARIMIGMRLAGKTQEEVDAWLEETIQEIERIEKEMASG